MAIESFWPIITELGDLKLWLLGFFIFAMWLRVTKPKLSKHAKRAIVILFATLVVVSISTQIIKMAVDAPRICTVCPAIACNPYCPVDDPYGFPSGHAAIAFAMFTAAWLVPRNNKERMKWLWVFILPVLASASRIALDVHTVEQVAAGALLGIAVAAIVWYFLKK